MRTEWSWWLITCPAAINAASAIILLNSCKCRWSNSLSKSHVEGLIQSKDWSSWIYFERHGTCCPSRVTVESSIFQLLNSSCLSKKTPKTQHWETTQSFFQWWLNDDVCAQRSRKKAFHHKLFYKKSLPCAPANVRLSSLFHLKRKKNLNLNLQASSYFFINLAS